MIFAAEQQIAVQSLDPTRSFQPIDQTSPSDRASFLIVDLARGAAIYRLRSRRALANARRDIFRPANRAAWCRRRDWWKFSSRVPPAIGTTKISLFVLVASTSSMLLVYATSWPSGEIAYMSCPPKIERRHIVIARREISWLGTCSGGRAGSFWSRVAGDTPPRRLRLRSNTNRWLRLNSVNALQCR